MSNAVSIACTPMMRFMLLPAAECPSNALALSRDRRASTLF
jgi:hypothetical protein